MISNRSYRKRQSNVISILCLSCLFLTTPENAFSASSPSPANGSEDIKNNVALSWDGDAFWYMVIWGTNAGSVEDAVEGDLALDTSYDPGRFSDCTTIYWRVDELDVFGGISVKGEVWHFTTQGCVPEVVNLVGWWTGDEPNNSRLWDESGNDLHGDKIGDPNWTDGMIGRAVILDGNDGFQTPVPANLSLTSATLTAWVRPNTLTTDNRDLITSCGANASGLILRSTNELGYHWNSISAASDFSTGLFLAPHEWSFVALVVKPTQALFYLNDLEPVVHSFNHGAAEFDGPLTLGADLLNPDQSFSGSLDDLRLYDGALAPEQLQEIKRGHPTLAWQPQPAPGKVVDIETGQTLNWQAGAQAVAHDVYLGTEPNTVRDANNFTPDVYQGMQTNTSFSFNALPDHSFYWRIDEITGDGTVTKGTLWSFRVGDTLIIDDFEHYTDFEPGRIFDTWLDGYFDDNNGSVVGYLDPPYCELGITHGGGHAMPLLYNSNGATVNLHSEVSRTLDPADQDLTRNESTHLVFWYRGHPDNTVKPTDKLYVKLDTSKVVFAQAQALTGDTWQQAVIPLSDFGHPNLNHVTTIAFGIGNDLNPGTTGSGVVYFDDVGVIHLAD